MAAENPRNQPTGDTAEQLVAAIEAAKRVIDEFGKLEGESLPPSLSSDQVDKILEGERAIEGEEGDRIKLSLGKYFVTSVEKKQLKSLEQFRVLSMFENEAAERIGELLIGIVDETKATERRSQFNLIREAMAQQNRESAIVFLPPWVHQEDDKEQILGDYEMDGIKQLRKDSKSGIYEVFERLARQGNEEAQVLLKRTDRVLMLDAAFKVLFRQ